MTEVEVEIERYRAAEARLWAESGVVPIERSVALPRHGVTVRVQEAGEGPPVLFLHGGPNAGSAWAPLVARLPDFRCLVLDRPGTGLSEPFPIRRATAASFFESLVVDVLDGLGLERAHLIGSSTGSDFALLAAAHHPERVGMTVHFGCPGFTPGAEMSLAWRLFSLPLLWRLAAAMRVDAKGVRSTLRQLGHGASLDAGRITDAMIDWSVALAGHTRTMHHEMEGSAAIITVRGIAPELVISRDALAAIESATLFVWGDGDPFGAPSLGQQMVEAMPQATLEVLEGAGHLAWLDDVDHAAAVIRRHLAESAEIAASAAVA